MSLSRRLAFLSCVALFALGSLGCDVAGETDASTTAPTTGPGGSPGVGGHGVGGGAGGDDVPTPQGGHGPVHLGLTANPVALGGVAPTPDDVLNAELTVYAAGVGAILLDVRFDALDEQAFAQLEQRVAAYAERGLEVILTVTVVDGLVAQRPAAAEGLDWDDPDTVSALEGLLSEILSRSGAKVSVLVLGRRVDAYLEAHPAEATALRTLLEAGLSHVKSLREEVVTGVGLSYLAVPRAAFAPLAALGDALVLSYLPGLGDASYPTDTAPAKDLDAMVALAAGEQDDAPRPIVLHAVAHPSAEVLAVTPEGQRQQLDAFFAAFTPRRSWFSHVNVHQLHDLDDAACEALVEAQGLDGGDPWGSYMCSTGLRGVDGVAKPAWTRFLQAAAALAE